MHQPGARPHRAGGQSFPDKSSSPLTLVYFPAFPDEQKHRRRAALHKQVCPQEKWLPNLQSSLSGEEEMGPKCSPGPEMLVGTSLARLSGVLTLWTTALLGHHISSPPTPSPLRFRTGLGFADQQKNVAVQWQSVDHGRRAAGSATCSSAASLQPQAFVCRTGWQSPGERWMQRGRERNSEHCK